MSAPVALDLYDDSMKHLAHFRSVGEAVKYLKVTKDTLVRWAMSKRPRDGMYLAFADPAQTRLVAARIAARANRKRPVGPSLAEVQRNAASAVALAMHGKAAPSWMTKR